jgi:hypothetical protein
LAIDGQEGHCVIPPVVRNRPKSGGVNGSGDAGEAE